MAKQFRQNSEESFPPNLLAEMLSVASGKPVTEADIVADIAAGAPVTSGGDVLLLPYIIWLYHRIE